MTLRPQGKIPSSNRHSFAWFCRRMPPSITSRSWFKCRRSVWSKVRPCLGTWLVSWNAPPTHPFAERGAGQWWAWLTSLPAGFSVSPRDLAPTPGCPLFLSSETLWLWADVKKALAKEPEGLRMLAQAFPGSEAASRWSQALERLEQRSRPYLQEVQQYETYRWVVL